MRCSKCNVDLGEQYTKCPLCGERATSEEPRLKGVATAEYLKYENTGAKQKHKVNYPQKYALRVALVLSVIFGVAALFGERLLWQTAVPAMLALCSVVYFAFGAIEKGRLLHSAVALVSTLLSSIIITLISLLAKSDMRLMLLSLAVSAVLTLVLFAIKPKRFAEQMKAIFSL